MDRRRTPPASLPSSAIRACYERSSITTPCKPRIKRLSRREAGRSPSGTKRLHGRQTSTIHQVKAIFQAERSPGGGPNTNGLELRQRRRLGLRSVCCVSRLQCHHYGFGSLFRWRCRLYRPRFLSNLCRPAELRFRWHGASFLKPAFAAVNLAPGIPTSLGVARST